MAKQRENFAFSGGMGHSPALHDTSSEKLAKAQENRRATRRGEMWNGAAIGTDATQQRR